MSGSGQTAVKSAQAICEELRKRLVAQSPQLAKVFASKEPNATLKKPVDFVFEDVRYFLSPDLNF